MGGAVTVAELFQREWKLAKPAVACGGCGQALAVSPVSYASLHEEGEAYTRRDTCSACWEKGSDRGFSFWAYRPAPPPAPAPRADLGAIREFYLKLAGKDGASDRLLRYMLGLFLVRKKRLRLDRTERGPEGEVLWIRTEKDGAPEAVPVPPFTEADLAETRRRLDALLGIDVTESAPAAAAEAGA